MHAAGEARLAIVGDWLVAANKEQLGQQVVDRLLEEGPGAKGALSAKESFVEARPDAPHTAWGWVDLAAWRQAGAAEDLFRGQAKDFGGELILGGVLAALAESPYAAFALDINQEGVSLAATVPSSAVGDSEPRDYFFGAANQGAAPPAIAVEHNLGTIRAYRDIAALWRQGPDLFNEQVNAGLAKAESDLSTLFGGKSFSDEILPSLGQQVQLVFARQDFAAADGPVPAIKLPAGGAIFRLTAPDQSQRPLRIAFQSLIGFVNLSAPQEGRSPLELMTEKINGATLVSTAYDPAAAADKSAAAVQFNFSPTIAFVGDWFVLSSTRSLAVDVVARLAAADQTPAAVSPADAGIVNTAVNVDLPALQRLLAENHEHLVAQNMLEEGHDREAAEAEIAALETIVGWLDAANLELAVRERELQLTVSVDLAK